ncbi:MAG: hypothetical protein Q9217_006979 [Psora testacea]
MIKSAPPPTPQESIQKIPGQRSPAMERMALVREYEIYEGPGPVKTNPFIRKLHDVVGQWEMVEERGRAGFDRTSEDPPCLVFEWMEHVLWNVPAEPYREKSVLPKMIARSVLEALDIFASANAIHTDVNPNNIFLSNIDSASPVVKLGDLGNLMREGFNKYRIQPIGCRAPEVWRGLGCWPSSDIWSLGVTLAHWLGHKAFFGISDKVVEGLTESWCIAKIDRLIGPLGPPVQNPEYESEFRMAGELSMGTYIHPEIDGPVPYIDVSTLRQELESLSSPKVDPRLLDFIDSLLIVDHTKRPTAAEALKHPYLGYTPLKSEMA